MSEVSAPRSKDPYRLDPGFERAVVALACTRPRFYGRIAHALDAELLEADASKLAMRAAHEINRDVGHGPGSTVLVVQRARRWMSDGKVTLEQVRAVVDLFDDAEDAGLPAEDDVVSELAPMLQRRLRSDAVRVAIEDYGKQGDLSRVMEMETRAQRIGQVDTSVGTVLGAEGFEEIASLRDLERLSTGVMELDMVLDGGLQRSGLGVAVGASGDGKSMFLSQVGGISVLAGLHVGYASLELPRPLVLARLAANMSGVPINAIVNGHMELAKTRLANMSARLGRCVVQDFTPHATTVDDITEWVKACEDHAGRKMDLLITDYGDKLTAKSGKGEKDSSEYTMGRKVFEALRVFAVEHKMFSWTASQATRNKDKKNKRLDLNDVADSIHKIRVADLVVTLNLRDEGGQMVFYVAKHRTGRSRMEVGPLPVEFEMGRVAPVLFGADGVPR